jgi:hypothetical protein
MYAIKFPDGKIDQYFVGETRNDVWYDRAYHLMCHLFSKEGWEAKFNFKLEQSKKDFKKRGFKIVKVKVVEE